MTSGNIHVIIQSKLLSALMTNFAKIFPPLMIEDFGKIYDSSKTFDPLSF